MRPNTGPVTVSHYDRIIQSLTNASPEGETVFYKRRIPKAIDEHTRTLCDFCGATIAIVGWDKTTITLEATVGDVVSEGDQRYSTTFDCCLVCWESKILQILQTLAKMSPEPYRTKDGRLPSATVEPW